MHTLPLSESPSSTPTAVSSPCSPSAPRRPAGSCARATGAVPPARAGGDEAERAPARPGGARRRSLGLPRAGLPRCCPTSALVVCTGRSTVAQRVRGLRLGVDDWITKPCHPEEAIARIEAVSRRRRRGRARATRPARSSPASWRSAPTASRPSSATAASTSPAASSSCSTCSPRTRGQVLEREAIYQRVWGYAMAHGDRSVDVFIRKLRQKLEKRSPSWSYIHTHFGIGYRFDPEPAGIVAEEMRPAPERAAAGAAAEPQPASFTSRSQQLHGRITGARRSRMLGAMAGGTHRRRRAAGDHARGARGAGRRPPAEPDRARAAAAGHPRRAPAADHDPRGALRRGLGRQPRRDDRSVDVYVSRLRVEARRGAARTAA